MFIRQRYFPVRKVHGLLNGNFANILKKHKTCFFLNKEYHQHNMKVYIKNMVCNRCKMAVKAELEKVGLHPVTVELGEVEITGEPSKNQLEELNTSLKHLGFELIDNRKGKIIEKIKVELIRFLQNMEEYRDVNLSSFLSNEVHYDYTYLSNLFSEVEGTTIEKYFINLKIEKVKELLMYDELSLSQIADMLGYSSDAYLSGQFKKITGLTPSFYKSLKEHKRKNIDEL